MAKIQSASGYDREHKALLRRFRIGLGLILLLLILGGLVLGFAVVRDEGMRPDYPGGRPVVYLRVGRGFKRGDLVCLRLPDGNTAVRRVIASAGDSVELRDGLAWINGLTERGNYSFTRTDPHPDGPVYPLILRPGELFVLGDAREAAVDSRDFGVVRTEEILGRVLF